MKKTSPQRGFTLVEIMVSLFVLSVLMAGVLSFFVQSIKSMYATEQRTKLAGQIKKFTNELIVQASRSNQFILYKSANAADFDDSNASFVDVNGVTVPSPDRQRISTALLHPAGNFAVFVYFEIPKPTNQPKHRITKIEGYFLTTAVAGGTGPVRKILIDLSAAPSTSTVEAILTANWSTATFSTCFPLARGVAIPEIIDGTPVSGAAATPGLFYMSNSRNVIISGQLYSSGNILTTFNDVNTNDWKTYTNSFYFNITPRT